MDEKIGSANEYLEEAKKISEGLYEFLEHNKFENSWNKITANTQSSKQVQNQKKLWFDGFRTLKLIHYLRDNNFPNEPMFSVLDELFLNFNIELNIKNDINKLPSPNNQKKYLDQLRDLIYSIPVSLCLSF